MIPLPDLMALPPLANLTETQRKILAAALEVFAEKGFAGASTAAIAALAGVAEKTLFAQFKTKAKLLESTLNPSVLTLIDERFITGVEEALSQKTGLAGVLTSLLTDRVGIVRRHPKVLKLVAHEALLHPAILARAIATVAPRIAPRMAATFRDLAAAGELRKDLPLRTILRTIIGVTFSYAMAKYVLGLEGDDEPDEEIGRIVDILVNGLRPR